MNKLLRLLSRFNGSKNTSADAAFASIELTTGAPGMAVERVFKPDHVFEDETTLLTYECLGKNFRLIFTPGKTETPVPVLYVFYENEIMVAHELPELGLRANFRQVSVLPQYLSLSGRFKQAAAKSAGTKSASGMSTPATFTIALLVFVCTVLFFSGATQPIQATSALAAKTATPAFAAKVPGEPVVATSLTDQLTPDEKQILAQVVAASGIELTSGGKPFVIFSDPNCPSCRQFESQLGSIDKSLSPVVVPVSFQKNSAQAVSAVLCSKDVAAAWKAAASGQPVTTEACEKGQVQAQTNNATFTALRFDRTPTIVTSTGKVAVGVKDFDGLMKWIKANS